MAKTIEEVEKMQVAGNAFSDQGIMNAAHDVIANVDLPMSERIRGLAVLDKVMGEEGELTEEAVEAYLKEC